MRAYTTTNLADCFSHVSRAATTRPPAGSPAPFACPPSEREERLLEAHRRELADLRAKAEELQEARDKQVRKEKGGRVTPHGNRAFL